MLLTIGIVVGIMAVVIIVFMVKTFFGYFTINEKGALVTKSDKIVPTEEQLEILYNSGSWGDDLEDIKENGMDGVTRAYVETAQMMMEHLEEKYGVAFMACGGNGGSGLLGGGDFEMFMYALEGEYAYEKFEATYGFDEKGNAFYEDGYYLLIHTEELREKMQKMVDDAELDIKIVLWIHGSTGYVEEQGKELAQVFLENNVDVNIHAYTKNGLSDEEFYRQSKELKVLFERLGIQMDITTRRLVNESDFEAIKSNEDELKLLNSYVPVEQKWDLTYDEDIYIDKK